jgi:hypothetical protein
VGGTGGSGGTGDAAGNHPDAAVDAAIDAAARDAAVDAAADVTVDAPPSSDGGDAPASDGAAEAGLADGSPDAALHDGGPLPATSLLQNFRFDTDVANWAPLSDKSALSRNSNDANGSTQSGSLDVVVTADSAAVSVEGGATQCVPVIAGATYAYDAQVLFPMAEGQDGNQAGVWVKGYPTRDCSGTFVWSSQPTLVAPSPGWLDAASAIVPPAPVQSISFQLVVSKGLGKPSAEAMFDNVVLTTAIAPASLVTNYRFDAAIDGWQLSPNASATRSSQDANGSAQSGSLDLAVSGRSAGAVEDAYAYQCVPVTPGAAYDLQASLFIQSGHGVVQGSIGAWFYDSSDCTGAADAMPTTANRTAEQDSWQLVTLTNAALAPSTARSMAVRLVLTKPLGQTAGEVLFDNVLVNFH